MQGRGFVVGDCADAMIDQMGFSSRNSGFREIVVCPICSRRYSSRGRRRAHLYEAHQMQYVHGPTGVVVASIVPKDTQTDG